MKTPPIDHASIARAMKAAAIMARTGTREQKAGRFLPKERAALKPEKAA
mgnify:CR=1 FL=1